MSEATRYSPNKHQAEDKKMKNLTKNEKAVLLATGNNDYVDEPGDPCWTDIVSDWCKIEGKQFSGICASLHKKGLVDSDDSTMWLTEKGVDVFNELMGNDFELSADDVDAMMAG